MPQKFEMLVKFSKLNEIEKSHNKLHLRFASTVWKKDTKKKEKDHQILKS